MNEFDELKRAAEAATPGPWEYLTTASGFRKIKASGKLICGVSSFGCQDAEFIAAANPATILALIARLEAAETELAQEQKRLDWSLKHGAVMGRVMLTWFSGTGEPSTKTTNAEHVRATIDELMQEVG